MGLNNKCDYRNKVKGIDVRFNQSGYSARMYLKLPLQHTEVGRAFLIHFKKIFLNKVSIEIKIDREFKFHM